MSGELELIAAVKGGDLGGARELLDADVDVDQQDDQGWTPLNWAAGRGDVDAVRLLLQRGADVTRTGRDNRSPLMIAKAAGRKEVAALLTNAEKERGVWVDPRETRPYCKAHYLRDLRRFEGWRENEEAMGVGDGGRGGTAAGGDDEDRGPLTDESIVYIHQDFTVTRSMFHGEDVVFDEVTPDWKGYCEQQLEFAIPEDLL